MVKGGDNDGNWFTVTDDQYHGIADTQASESSASAFTITGTGQLLVSQGNIVVGLSDPLEIDDGGQSYYYYIIAPNPGADSAATTQLQCTIAQNSDGSCPLNCVGIDGGITNYDCGATWHLSRSVEQYCYGFTPYVVSP